MTYKSIVTFVTDAEREADLLSAAIAIATDYEAHLRVICLGIDRTQPGAYYAGANAIALQHSLSEATEQAGEIETAVSARLAQSVVAWDAVAATAQINALNHIVAERAQFADLVLLQKPYGEGREIEHVAVLESALFGTRVPILVLPQGYDRALSASRIILAWNESIEALSAIRAALPLLEGAKTVDIAIIDPPTHSADRSDPGGFLAEMLSRRGIRADISVLAKTMPRISDVLCRHISDKDADLLVMGAYGHSRFREAILGGATRNMLEMATVPVLMTH